MSKKKNYTHISFVLDRSGSMASVLNDTIGGFNSFLDEQKKSGNKISFWLTLFNSDKIEKRYIKEDLKNVEQLSDDNYVPNHSTPLWDAVGKTIQEFSKEKEVLFIVMTDGQENASTEFTSDSVKELIKEKEKKFDWKFLYLGVGVEDFKNEAMAMGMSMSFHEKRTDVRLSSERLNRTVSNYVATNKVDYDQTD